jgi:hypothetical protein
MGRASTAPSVFLPNDPPLSDRGSTTRTAVQAAWQKAAERVKQASGRNTNEKKRTN